MSNQLFETPAAATVLNDAHQELVGAIARGDCAGVRWAVEKDICVDGPLLRPRLRGSRQRWACGPLPPARRRTRGLRHG